MEGNMSNFDNSQISEEDKKAFAEMDHFDALKAEQGYETVWSIETGIVPLDHKIFTNKPRVVKYKVIKEMGATFDDVTYETFTCMAQNGTVGALWTAAESCFKQAKLALGDWHYFIEDFEVQDDGSLQLVTGS
jgi:hypothetical protein|tara:strand:- start:844 stop:1242 length:399 start_codon:yes stop_codon:yes gene_type:complete